MFVCIYPREQTIKKCDHLSEIPSSSRNFQISFLFSLHCSRNGSPKFESIMVSSFGIAALDHRKSKEIGLYSDYTKINYRHLHSQP